MRCSHKLHGLITETGLVEVSCNSRWCGKEPGTIVLHRFNAETGELVETLKFKAPPVPHPNERKA